MPKKNRIPSWIPTLLVAVALFAVVLYAGQTGRLSTYWYQVIQLAALTAISALGLNLIYGFNGQFSLGHIGFYAIGAYGSALVTKDFAGQWSGSNVGGVSWMIAGEIGVLSVLYMVRLLRIGVLAKRIRASLEHSLKGHEAWVISAVVTLTLVAVSLVVGVVVAWLMHGALAAALGWFFGVLPETWAQPVVFVLALLAGATMAARVGDLVGLPLLRLGSDYFGIATLGFSVMMYTALQNSDLVIATMKGARGMVAIPRWTTWGWVFGALVLSVIVVRNLVHSSHGRAIMSVREDEIAAQSMGIDLTQYKTVAFSFGAFFAGLAGGLYAHLFGFLHPSSFNMIKGFDPLIIIVFGGLGSMTGTIVASAGFALVIEGLRVILPQGFRTGVSSSIRFCCC
jgi:branched-chain amino acid transport system permease protein